MHNKWYNGTKEYVCDVCGYSTITDYTLTLHRKRHLGEYNFKCDVCDKCFISKHALKNRKIVHLAKKQFKCDVCERAYFYKGDLTTHIKICHPSSKQNSSEYQCRTCGHTFRLKKRLVAHLKSHTGFLCDVCGKALTSRTSLQGHHLTHTGEKPVVCDVCGKAFVKCGALRIHMLTHTGERPHSCEVCGKTLTQRFSLFTNSTTQEPNHITVIYVRSILWRRHWWKHTRSVMAYRHDIIYVNNSGVGCASRKWRLPYKNLSFKKLL